MSLEIWDDDMAEAMEQAEGQQELEEGVLMENIGEMQQELGGLMESFKDFFEGDDISGDPEKDMENLNYRNCNEEVTVKLIGKLTMELPELEVNLPKQLEIKRLVEEVFERVGKDWVAVFVFHVSSFRVSFPLPLSFRNRCPFCIPLRGLLYETEPQGLHCLSIIHTGS